MNIQAAQKKSTWFERYILPGFVLKAAIIGGGYLSGRELEQYFGSLGPVGGLIGMAIATLLWSCVYAATLEFARVHHSYDYRSFFKNLLGPAWVVFEIAYFAMILVALSVFTSVSGNIFHSVTSIAITSCELGFMAAVATLLFFGTRLVERFLSLWSFVLYTAFGTLVFLCFYKFGTPIVGHLAKVGAVDVHRTLFQGVKYAGYNISTMTAALFCARHIATRRDALVAGMLGGPLAMIPGMLFFLSLSAFDPQIHTQPVPVEYLLGKLDIPVFRAAFLTVMAITLLGTCCALIHAVNERVAQAVGGPQARLSGWKRAAIAAVIMSASFYLAARVGLVDLVDKGYGIMAWAFIITFMIPILTYGVWKIFGTPNLNISVRSLKG